MTRSNILSNPAISTKFVEACKALKNEPIGGGTYGIYDHFVFWHHRAMTFLTPEANDSGRNAAHAGPSFGPWHRLKLLVFEALARRVLDDQTFELPYWDWAADADDPTNSALWQVIGGDGTQSTGPFSTEFDVRMTQVGDSDQWMEITPRPFWREIGSLSTVVPSKLDVRDAIDSFSFYEQPPYNNTAPSFRRDLEIPLHNTVHRFIGGDMMNTTSPNDPVFFLHHCNIDRIWANWQVRNPTAAYAPADAASAEYLFHRLGDTLHNFLGIQRPISDFLQHTDWYEYDTLN